MRKNITIGFTPAEYMRLQGAAALSNVPLATYVKMLIQQREDDPGASPNKLVLHRLDQLLAGVRQLAAQESGPAKLPEPVVPTTSLSEVMSDKLRERGVPSSTIRQVVAVIDQVQQRR